jgi:serine/threonine protein kinase
MFSPNYDPRKSYDVATVDFLDKLLVLNPQWRPTASDALRHRYFNTEPAAAVPGSDQ